MQVVKDAAAEWNSIARRIQVLRKAEGDLAMQELNNWQRRLFSLLKEKEDCQRVYFTNVSDVNNVYVVVKKATFKVMEVYSGIYYQVLENADDYFELLVVGEEELDEITIPSGSLNINCKG